MHCAEWIERRVRRSRRTIGPYLKDQGSRNPQCLVFEKLSVIAVAEQLEENLPLLLERLGKESEEAYVPLSPK